MRSCIEILQRKMLHDERSHMRYEAAARQQRMVVSFHRAQELLS